MGGKAGSKKLIAERSPVFVVPCWNPADDLATKRPVPDAWISMMDSLALRLIQRAYTARWIRHVCMRGWGSTFFVLFHASFPRTERIVTPA